MEYSPKNIKSFIKRRKRISSQKKKVIAKDFLPTIKIDNYNGLNDKIRDKVINIEIGFGSGEHIVNLAQNNPAEHFIGCEAYYNGLVNLAYKVSENDVKNINIYDGDALELLSQFPDHSINKIFLLFPDPWPKRKHYKRRIVSNVNLDLIIRKLTKSGKLHIATDFENYADWILGKLSNHKGYTWLNSNKNEWLNIPEYFTPTKYYNKAREAGSDIYFFEFEPT